MPILDFPDFRDCLPPFGALVGLDPGSKTVGLAASDGSRTIATAVGGVKRDKIALMAPKIFAELDLRKGAGLVIGLPRNMDGSEGASAQSARAFARNLLGVRDLPILLWDERLSTAAVTRAMIEADLSRARRRTIVDAQAAAWTLQGLLDRLQEERVRALPPDAPEAQTEGG